MIFIVMSMIESFKYFGISCFFSFPFLRVDLLHCEILVYLKKYIYHDVAEGEDTYHTNYLDAVCVSIAQDIVY